MYITSSAKWETKNKEIMVSVSHNLLYCMYMYKMTIYLLKTVHVLTTAYQTVGLRHVSNSGSGAQSGSQCNYIWPARSSQMHSRVSPPV